MRRTSIAGLAALFVLTLTPALLAQDQGTTTSWFQMFIWPPGDVVGTALIWIIIAMSAGNLALIIRFAIQYRRPMLVPDQTRDEIEALIADRKYRDAIEYANNDPSYLGQLLSAALSEASNGYSAMERAIEETGDAQTTRYLRPIEYLNVLGSVGPMMGLFGTVYGMIVAFEQLVASGGRPDPAQLAGGISTALVTTFWGLLVGIPALTAYALIRNKIDALTSEGVVITESLISPFKPGAKRERKGRERDPDRGDRSGEEPQASASASERPKPQPRASRPRATPRPELPAD